MLVYEKARKDARAIRARYPGYRLSMNELVRIAGTYEAMVIFEHLDPKVSGLVVKEDGSAPIIYINSLEPEQRQRFTLAHEIGHLVERRDAADDEYSFVDFRTVGNYDLHEFYADEFAGALLMPTRMFLEYNRKNTEFATADEFGVSVDAVKKRAARLEKHPDSDE